MTFVCLLENVLHSKREKKKRRIVVAFRCFY